VDLTMLLRLPVFCLLLMCSACAAPQTRVVLGTAQQPLDIGGYLQEDLSVGGEVRVLADLIIPAGRSLTFLAGTRVKILGTDSTKIDPEVLDKGSEILVRGRLLVIGTPQAPVTFMLDPETPSGENWAGIELLKAEEARILHADIHGAEIGILSIDSNVQLEQVNLLGSNYGLLLQGQSRLSYLGGRIAGGNAGLLCYDFSLLQLEDLQIVDNQEEGLYLAAGCRLQQRGLSIARNDLGLVAGAEQGAELTSSLSANRIDFKPLSGGRAE
jgi:hypothetical protein